MPADIPQLIDCLSAMKSSYLANPTGSVRGSAFIYHLHDYCSNQLLNAISPDFPIQAIPIADMKTRPKGIPHTPKVPIEPQKLQLMEEATLFGSHKNKDTDLVLSQYANGPQIIIGIRSQMSSVANNIENYYEGIIGECISLHDRFPMATIGYVYLLPKHPIKPGLTEEVDLDKAERLFEKITAREDWHAPHDRYEHFAFLKVDFDSDPPNLLTTSDILKIDYFFDKLIDTHNSRNVFNQIPRR